MFSDRDIAYLSKRIADLEKRLTALETKHFHLSKSAELTSKELRELEEAVKRSQDAYSGV